MNISFKGPCGKRFLADMRHAGKRFACPRCHLMHTVPGQRDCPHGERQLAGEASREHRIARDESRSARPPDHHKSADPIWPWLRVGFVGLVCLVLLVFVFQQALGRDRRGDKQTLPQEQTTRPASSTDGTKTPPAAKTQIPQEAGPVHPAKDKELAKSPRLLPIPPAITIVEWYPVEGAVLVDGLVLLAVHVRLPAGLVDASECYSDYCVLTSTGPILAFRGVGWERLTAKPGNFVDRGLLFVVSAADVNAGKVYFQYRDYPRVLLAQNCRKAPPAPDDDRPSETPEPKSQPAPQMPEVPAPEAEQSDPQRPGPNWRDYLPPWDDGYGNGSSGPSDAGGSGGPGGSADGSGAGNGMSVTSSGVILLNFASLRGHFRHDHKDRDKDKDKDKWKDKAKDNGKGKDTGGKGMSSSKGSNGQPPKSPSPKNPSLNNPSPKKPSFRGQPAQHPPAFRHIPGHAPYALPHGDAPFRRPPSMRGPMRPPVRRR